MITGTKDQIVVGIEIELMTNTDFEHGGYGYDSSEYFCEGWRIGTDGSLDTSEGYEYDYEIVSEPTAITRVDNLMRNFFDTFGLNHKEHDKSLKGIMGFNNSMGCHIHMSIKEKLMRIESAYIEEFITKIFFKELQDKVKKGLVSRVTAKRVIEHYYRDYAKKNNGRRVRGAVHFSQKGTIEWRSFNLLGAKTVGEVINLIDAGMRTIKKLLRYNRKYILEITEEEIKCVI